METTRLAAIPFFAELPEEQLAAIAEVAREVEVEPGTSLATEGDFGHCLYAIEEGTADVVSDGEVLRSLGPGDIAGEIAVLVSGRRSASVVATSRLRAISLFKRDVWRLEEQAPEAGRRLRELIEARV